MYTSEINSVHWRWGVYGKFAGSSVPSFCWREKQPMKWSSGAAPDLLAGVPPYLRFAFQDSLPRKDREEGIRCRSTQIGGLIRAVQSPVCPKPFVVMCHTPARQTASWSGQQQTQLVEPRLSSLPLLCVLQLPLGFPTTYTPFTEAVRTQTKHSTLNHKRDKKKKKNLHESDTLHACENMHKEERGKKKFVQKTFLTLNCLLQSWLHYCLVLRWLDSWVALCYPQSGFVQPHLHH